MKSKIKIEGLECANCARTLEKEINKLEIVKNAQFDFASSTLKFESENVDGAVKEIAALTKKLEPQARVISPNSAQNSTKKKSLIWDVLSVLVGIGLMVVLWVASLETWAFWTIYVLTALILGWKTYLKAVRLLFRGVINENLLITISVIGASFPNISSHLEGLMVIALYSIGKIFENLAIDKSRRSIAALAQMQPDSVTLLVEEDGNKIEKIVPPSEVEVGSLILVKAGEKIALDGIVESGTASLDTQSLTGESLPSLAKVGDSVLSGAIVLDSPLTIRTTTPCSESTISKIMNLVENASENKSKTETFISKITKWYTLAVVGLAVLVWGIVWAVTGNLNDAFYRGLTFLVISCPCAFAISVPLTYFSGLGNASKHGILVKGSNHLDTCARVSLVAFDKTGTLTTGQFSVNKITTLNETLSEEEVLFLCALGEQNSLHPLAKAILAKNTRPLQEIKNSKEISGCGVEFEFEGAKYFVGRRDFSAQNAQTTVELHKNGEKIGEIELSDSLKGTSKETCEQLRKMGVKTAMLSGDNAAVAEKIGQELGLDEVHGRLLPQDKFAWLEDAKKEHCVAYVGDGLNDAPALAAADVGISMSISASPASIEAADVVLVDDNPKNLVSAIKIAKRTKKIVWENIILAAVVKVTFLTLGALGVTGMMWAVFADVGVTVLAILNSLRALSLKK